MFFFHIYCCYACINEFVSVRESNDYATWICALNNAIYIEVDTNREKQIGES